MVSAAFVLAALCVVTGSATDILVIGDTWADASKVEFQQMLTNHSSNLTVSWLTEAGSTAKTWQDYKHTQLITDTVANCTGLRAIWMSIGGYDEYQDWMNCNNTPIMCAAGNGGTDQAVLSMFFAVWAAKPTVKIVGTGYDIPAVENCPYPKDLIPTCVGNTTCYNYWQVFTLQGLWNNLPMHDPLVTGLNLNGIMQAAAGYPGASIGHPDLSRYSPAEYFQNDCFTPNSKGFTVFFEEMWKQYFSKL